MSHVHMNFRKIAAGMSGTRSPFGDTLVVFNKAADHMQLNNELRDELSKPNENHSFTIDIKDRTGSPQTYEAFRVQYNNIRGPYKGGIRYHQDASLDLFQSLAAEMTWKTAVTNVPFGGGKGGIIVDPKTLTEKELKDLSIGYMKKAFEFVGPKTDILAPDVNTDSKIMQYMVDEYAKHTVDNSSAKAVATGKDVKNGGSEGRQLATGQGLAFTVDEWFKSRGESVNSASYILQGFGNVGSWAAKILSGLGAKLIAVGDVGGAIFNENGIDAEDLDNYVKNNPEKTVAGYDKSENISDDELFSIAADFFVPAALGGVITPEVAKSMKVKMIVEGANGPTTPEGDEVLIQRGVEVIPDILANAGGVTVSYYEWIQNLKNERWSEKQVADLLSKNIRSNFRIVQDISNAQDRKSDLHDSSQWIFVEPCDMRTAAMVLALKRIENAYLTGVRK